jgi:hypothetical protein
MDPSKREEQFEFEWSLKITLPPTLDAIKSIDLKIESLTFGEHTSISKKKEMIHMFGDYLENIPSMDESSPSCENEDLIIDLEDIEIRTVQ